MKAPTDFQTRPVQISIGVSVYFQGIQRLFPTCSPGLSKVGVADLYEYA